MLKLLRFCSKFKLFGRFDFSPPLPPVVRHLVRVGEREHHCLIYHLAWLFADSFLPLPCPAFKGEWIRNDHIRSLLSGPQTAIFSNLPPRSSPTRLLAYSLTRLLAPPHAIYS
jgi:hypothetical protein